MYKPQYLNAEMKLVEAMAGNRVYFRKVTRTQLGWRKKPPETPTYKSGRRFARKVRWSDISRQLG